MKKILIGISAGALALATAGFAADMKMGGDMAPTMTRVEAKSAAEQAFAKLDLNQDGKLDAGDRTARTAMMFDKIDANKDGSISRDEFIAAHEKMREHMGHMGMGGPGMGGMGGEGREHGRHMGPGHGKMGLLMAILHVADPNHTGSVSKDAFVNGALTLFDKTDTNHDGKVTGEERRAAHAAMRKQMQERMGKGGMGRMGMGGMGMGDMPPPPAK